MPLVTCPDCLKQVSDRVESCPFCGCPSKFFLSGTSDNDTINSSVSMAEKSIPSETIVEEKCVNSKEDFISFSFGKFTVRYPKNTENIAKIYGKYVSYSHKYYQKYYELYASAGSMHSVLTDLVDKVKSDIRTIADEACQDLYQFGIRITSTDFINEYEIDCQREIETLYEQYDSIQEEKKDIEYQREVQKASRGRWQGGGFGMKGAIKGAVNAAVLNAGSGLIHSIGDGISKSGDNRYISNKLNGIYKSKKNQEEFSQGVYRCIDYILEGIKEEMSNAEIIDISVFGSFSDVESNYETVMKYEKNPERLLEGMIDCFSCIPEGIKYYKPVLSTLFESDSDIELFLKFWGLDEIYQQLEQEYSRNVLDSINNPFIRNTSEVGIEILNSSNECENGITVIGKVLKGKIQVGDAVTVLQDGFCAGISTTIVSISIDDESISATKLGKVYQLVLAAKQSSLMKQGSFLVDSNCFEKVESDLYAKYIQNGETIIWGFAEYCGNQGKGAIFNFDSQDNYISCRGVDFSYDVQKIKTIYGDATEKAFDCTSDVPLKYAKDNNWVSAITSLNTATFSITYVLSDEYTIRFYFNQDKKLVLVVYMKNIDTSKESDSEENTKIVSKIQLQIECKKCGKLLKNDMKFCNYCGEPNPLFYIECPNCGKQIKRDVKFCNYCGYNILS